MSSVVRAVMIFSDDPAMVAAWWAELLCCPLSSLKVEGAFVWFDVGDVEFGFHPADASKNPVGGSPVVYLRVDDVSATLARAESSGARRHRGPLDVTPTRTIAQLVDPFGNVFGLDGPLH